MKVRKMSSFHGDKKKKIQWNHDSKLGEFLSRKGVQALLQEVREEEDDKMEGLLDLLIEIGAKLHKRSDR